MRDLPIASLAVGVLLVAGGCQGTRPARPSLFTHVVFFDLADPGDAASLVSDCDTLLTDIRSVETYACGRHIDTGRDGILADYDVGLVVGFASEADYAAYVADPLHLELVRKWKPRLEQLRVYDILDPTP